MLFSSWLRNWKRSIERRSALHHTLHRKPSARRWAPRPRLEALEDRLAPAIDAWTGAGSIDLWSNPANWQSGVAPRPGDTIVFNGAPQNEFDDYPSGTSFASIQFTVLNTNDSGPDSLRQAIEDADGVGFFAPGNVVDIKFDIGGGGQQSITPTSQLPSIGANVTIDGTTQPGYSGSPLIVINGSQAGSANGLVVGADNTTLRGMVINGFAGSGVYLGGQGDVLEGCYIGTSADGTQADGNSLGVLVEGARGSTISDNLISGNGGNGTSGIDVDSSTNITIQGNKIGTDVTGNAGSTFHGVNNTDSSIRASNDSNLNTLDNVISGGAYFGINLDSKDDHVTIQDNRIGTNATGTAALGNSYGIYMIFGIHDVQIGDNLISGNVNAVTIASNDCSNITLQGNFIGTDVTGTSAVPNTGHGIAATGDHLLIGGTDPGAGNLVSGNQYDGISIADTTGPVLIEGNTVGTDVTGKHAIGNTNGVVISNSSGVTVGVPVVTIADTNGATEFGSTVTITTMDPHPFVAGQQVVIAGVGVLGYNGTFTITSVPTATTFTYTASTTGLVASGGGLATVVPVTTIADTNGATESGSTVTITTTDPHPFVAGQQVVIAGVGVQGYDGTFTITSVPTATTFTYTASTTGLAASGGGRAFVGPNVISGATESGSTVTITTTAPHLFVAGQQVVIAGVGVLGYNGTFTITSVPTATTFTYTASTTGLAASGGGWALVGGNLISGNTGGGVAVGNGASNDLVEGNFIGTDASGTSAIANGTNGGSAIALSGTGTSVVGNLVSGNGGAGIILGNASSDTVENNRIGTDLTGSVALPNQGPGVWLYQGDTGNQIGGPGQGNVISGNVGGGIYFQNPDNTNNLVQGNLIGTNAADTKPLGNGSFGVYIISGSDNTIGGTAADAGNVISGNQGYGIGLDTGAATGNIVEGNDIGTDVSGTLYLGNAAEGVDSGGGASNNLIGGTAGGAANDIAYNGSDGVLVDPGTNGVSVLGNSIHDNGGLGIHLNNGNDNQAAPVLNSVIGTAANPTITGTLATTARTLYRIEFFASAAPASLSNSAGTTFLGSTLVTGAGGSVSFTFSPSTAVPAGQNYFTATATVAIPVGSTYSYGDTSAFSPYLVRNVLTVSNPADSGTGSLRAAVVAADSDAAQGLSDVITFAAGFAGQTIVLGSALPELNGIGKITIDGSSLSSQVAVMNNSSRVFTVDLGLMAEFDNLTITSQVPSGSLGGGVANNGTLTVNDCTLSGGSANQGGAIYNNGTLTVSGSTMSGNTAFAGGAVYSDGSLMLSGCTLTHNSASDGSGGAIVNADSTASVAGCSFSSNSASSGGGAIANINGTLTVNNSTLSGNRGYDGGGIYNSGALTLSSSTLSLNSAMVRSVFATGAVYGGGVYNAGTATISSSTFLGNTAYCESFWDQYNSSVSAVVATASGGGIYDVGSKLSLSGCLLDSNSAKAIVALNTWGNNVATAYGGGLYSSLPHAFVTNCTLAGNVVSCSINSNDAGSSGNPANSGGGGMYLSGQLAFVSGCLLASNEAFSSATSTLNNSLNKVSACGGGVFGNGWTDRLTQCTLSGNSASSGGGIYVGSGALVLDDSTVFDNAANIGGGVQNNAWLTLTRSTIMNNQASSTGGGIYMAQSGSTTYVQDQPHSFIYGNTAPSNPDVFGSFSGTPFNTGAFAPTVTGLIASVSASGQITYTVQVVVPDGQFGGPVASGMVTLYDANGTNLGSAPLNFGSATFNVPAILGSQTPVYAAYGGYTDIFGIDYGTSESALLIPATNALSVSNVQSLAAALAPNNPLQSLAAIMATNGVPTAGIAVDASTTADAQAAANTIATAKAPSLWTGVARSGSTSTTITLDSGASNLSYPYVNASVTITYGTGVGQSRTITAYNPSTKVATVSSPWNVIPDSTSSFEIDAPVTFVLTLAQGSYQDLKLSTQPNVTLVVVGGGQVGTVNGTTIVGHSPAVDVDGGNVILANLDLTTATDAPTVLVTGGDLTVRDSTVEGSTSYSDPAIAVSGNSTVDLGTPNSPGGNTITVAGTAPPIQSTGTNVILTQGSTFQASGTTVYPAATTTLTSSANASAWNQAVTFTASVSAPSSGSPAPTGSVTFTDSTTGQSLGTIPLSGGSATLGPVTLSVGTHIITALYSGDSNYISNSAVFTERVIGTPTVAVADAGGTYNGQPFAATATVAGVVAGGDDTPSASLEGVGPTVAYYSGTYTSAAQLAGLTPLTGIPIDAGSYTVAASFVGSADYTSATALANFTICKANQTITWAAPAPIVYGTALSGTQLDATVAVVGPAPAGALTYSPAAGTVLSPGLQTLTVTAASTNDYNQATSSVTLPVKYVFSGFLPPLSQGLTYAVNRTIPIKFQLPDANGKAITSLSAVTSLQIQALDANGKPVGAPITPVSTNNQGLQYSGGQYLFNRQTKSLKAGSYQIVLTLADGTTQTKTIQLTAGGSSAGLVTDGSGGTATAGALLGGEVDLYVDNSNGDLTSDELNRIQDAVNSVDATIASYGVVINEVSDPTQANVTLNMNTTSSLGGIAQGVLGCTTDADQVTMIQGWSWYAGTDATQIGAGQYDFETAVMHELGHVLGLGHSSSSTSVMCATLAAGTANRTLVTADLNVPDSDSGPCALHAAPTVTVSSTSNGQDTTAPSSMSVPSSSGSPLSSMDQVFADFARMLSAAWNSYQSELSSVTTLWQTADALALQRLDALLSLEAGAMGMSKDTLMSDRLFASDSAPNGV
jgi:hypothetical protein